MRERWRRPLPVLAVGWVVLAVVWTAAEVAGYVTGGATAFESLRTIVRVGGIVVVIWLLQAFRPPRAGSS